jgi:GGDEF domain-containing protein
MYELPHRGLGLSRRARAGWRFTLGVLALALFAAALAASPTADDVPRFTLDQVVTPLPEDVLVDDVARKPSAAFAAVDPARLQQRVDAAVWLRLRFTADVQSPEPFVLVLREVRYARVSVYGPGESKPVTMSLAGAANPARFGRDGIHALLPSTLRAGDTWYIQLHRPDAGTRLLAQLSVESMATSAAASLRHARAITLMVGAFAALGLMAFMLWSGRREPAFLLLGACAAAQAVYVAFFFGEGFALLGFADDSPWTFTLYVVPGSLATGCVMLLYRELLDLQRAAPRVGLSLQVFAVVFFASSAIGIPAAGDLQRALVTTTNLAVLLSALPTAAAVWVGLKHHHQAARYLLLAWLISAVFLFWRVITLLMGEHERDSSMYYAVPLGQLLATLLFAWAAAERSWARRQLSPARTRRTHLSRSSEVDARPVPLLELIAGACERCSREGKPMAVAALRLADARGIAQRHGGAALTAITEHVLARLLHGVRADDRVQAVGEGEFVVMLVGLDGAGAQAAAARWQARISADTVVGDALKAQVKIDAGVAWATGREMRAEALLLQAEAALAMAARGDNRTVVLLAA